MTNKVAILISGRGSNMESLIKNSANFGFSVVCVISNNALAPGLKSASNYSIPTHAVQNGPLMEEQIISALKIYNPDLICLAGFMKILSPEFISLWQDKILNIHPSLLPAFKGLNAQKQALDYGVKIAGCTVHIVAPEVDSGKIILQGAVSVAQNDDLNSLSLKILKVEHKCYPLAVSKMFGDQTLVDTVFEL